MIEEELDDELGELFADFDEEPIAAASIGQVYRATLHDGRDVAVKVQYPGVAAAVRADMQNLGLIMRVVKRMTPGLDVKAITEEIRLRIDEELDYELEAQNQRSLARIFRGHPFIVVPDVVTRMSRERVIVSEFVEGIGFEELKGYPQAERDRIGEIIFRFFFGCLYRHHQFSGDPHPGNFLLHGRRPRRVPRLRALQADDGGGRRARAGARPRRRRTRTRRALFELFASAGLPAAARARAARRPARVPHRHDRLVHPRRGAAS